jgi:hypothetical protein
MRASNFGERKLTELDFTRLRKFTAAGAMPHLFQPEAAGDYVT